MGFFKKIIDKFKIKKVDVKKELIKKNKEQEEKINVHVASQEKFNTTLKKSADVFSSFINDVTENFKIVDQSFIDQLEEVLIAFDVGPSASNKIVNEIVKEIKYHNIQDKKLIKEIIIDKIFVSYIQDAIIDTDLNLQPNQTNVILVMGANGVGKTTSIAKLAYMLKNEYQKILLIAGDTFRAGAVEQLKIWAQRLNIDIIVPTKKNQDPASLIYEGMTKAQKEKYDVVICDTSGRLQNKTHLIAELAKLDKIIKKFDSNAPHESLLIIDATVGQSGLRQAEVFNSASKITGIILTKMDSTSKGGIIFAINDTLKIPVKYIGLGEKLEDLSVFDLERMVDSITYSLKL